MYWQPIVFGSPPAGTAVLLNCFQNPALILLAFLFCVFGTYNALENASHRGTGVARPVLPGLCLGTGLWCLHMLALLSMQCQVPTRHDTLLGLLVLLLAWLGAGLSLRAGRHPFAAASLLTAFTALIHYFGVATLISAATPYYPPALVATALLLMLSISLLGFFLLQRATDATPQTQFMARIAASLLLPLGATLLMLISLQGVQMAVLTGTLQETQAATLDAPLRAGLWIAMLALPLLAAYTLGQRLSRDGQAAHSEMRQLVHQLDITRASLEHLASYDPLTSFLNRKAFNDAFDEMLAVHRANQQRMAVIFIDIDHFKRVNDSLGHQAGDELLRDVAEYIRQSVREQDVVSRFSGDAFCILASLHESDEATLLARRIMQRLKEPIHVGGHALVMTASTGISIFPDDGEDAQDLLKHADLALHQSKLSGRNTIQFFNHQLSARTSMDLVLEEELRQAIRNGGLTVYYQPLLRLADEKIVKLEALVRWQHPQRGMMTPAQFLPVAELNGFIAELDTAILDQACRDLRLLADNGFPGLTITVNFSAHTLADERLPARIARTLARHGVPPTQVEMELTESALMSNVEQVANLLRDVQAQGIRVSIDDFGTGYSSLAYLRQLPLDTLKVDRAFVRNIPDHPRDMEVASAIIAMARKLHLSVVAEGVETREQLDFLRDNGCDHVQGYLISRPVPLASLAALLSTPPRLPEH